MNRFTLVMAFYLQNKAIVIVFYRYPQGPYSTNVGLADRPDGFEASIPSQYTGYLHEDIVTGKTRAMKTTQIGKMKFSHLGMLVQEHTILICRVPDLLARAFLLCSHCLG